MGNKHENGQTLSQVMPPEFRQYEDTQAYQFKDMRVVKEHCPHYQQDYYTGWIGSHKNVYYWVELENGYAVGWNENPSRGWSFPVLNINNLPKMKFDGFIYSIEDKKAYIELFDEHGKMSFMDVHIEQLKHDGFTVIEKGTCLELEAILGKREDLLRFKMKPLPCMLKTEFDEIVAYYKEKYKGI